MKYCWDVRPLDYSHWYIDNNRLKLIIHKSELNDVNEITLFYQLANPIILKNGQQGYKAPQSINIFKDGDLVIRGLHNKRYNLDNTNIINLSEEVEAIDYVRAEIDGQVQQLDYTLTNSTTITLTEPYSGYVQIKGYLPSKRYINPNIKASLSTSIGATIKKNTEVIDEINRQLFNEYRDNELIIMNHEQEINSLKQQIKTITSSMTTRSINNSISSLESDSLGNGKSISSFKKTINKVLPWKKNQ